MYSDQELIARIRKNENKAFKSLYNTEYNSIKKMVFAFNNLSLEPEDVFQEGLTRLILNVQSGRFRGDSALSTYLNAICKNICLKKLSRRTAVSMEPDIPDHLPEEDHHYELLDFISRMKNSMDEKCRSIIDLRFRQAGPADMAQNLNKLPGFEEIARQLNLSADNARQRFKRCLDQLKNQLLAHPEYETIIG